MPKFRKKPVVIDAFQWTGEPVKAWEDLDAWLVSLGLPTADEAEHDEDVPLWVNGDDSLTIPTLEGDHRCDIGDWIIRGVKGELYPCKPEIFALTYEPAGYAPPSVAGVSEEMQNDMAVLMRTLGISDHARSASPHEVMVNEIIPAVERLAHG